MADNQTSMENGPVVIRFSLPVSAPSTLATDASGATLDESGLVVYGNEVEQPGDELDVQSSWDILSGVNLSPKLATNDLSIFERIALYNLFRLSQQSDGVSNSAD